MSSLASWDPPHLAMCDRHQGTHPTRKQSPAECRVQKSLYKLRFSLVQALVLSEPPPSQHVYKICYGLSDSELLSNITKRPSTFFRLISGWPHPPLLDLSTPKRRTSTMTTSSVQTMSRSTMFSQPQVSLPQLLKCVQTLWFSETSQTRTWSTIEYSLVPAHFRFSSQNPASMGVGLP